MESIGVLVTGVSGGSIGEQVCKALRLGRRRYRIVAANASRAAMGVVRADAEQVLPAASAPEYLDRLHDAVARHAVQFVAPGSEPELVRLSHDRDAIARSGARLLANTPQVIDTCVDKQRCSEFLARSGFAVPRSAVVDEQAQWSDPAIPYPCIVKPARGGGGSASTFIAQDEDELRYFYRYLQKYGHRPLVQEYLADADNEFTVGVLHGPDGRFLGSAVLRRQILAGLSNRLRVANRSGRPELGAVLAVSSGISQGEFVVAEPVREACERIAQALGSRGPLNIQGRWDGSRFVPFEINPRFSGTAPFRALAGFNEPERLIDAYLGVAGPAGAAPPRAGVCLRGLTEIFTPEGEGKPAVPA